MKSFIHRTLVCLAALALACATGSVTAQTFPSKTITIIVPYPAGGDADAIARVLGQKLSPKLGQAVIIDNRVGASGTIGAALVAKAPADGHTLLFTPSTFTIAPHVLKVSAYDVVKDFSPVVLAVTTPMLLVASPDLKVKDAQELTKLVRGGTDVAYASPGSGSPMHVAGELFNKSAGVKTVHVPYKGVAPALQDLLGGHVPLMYASLSTVAAHLASGRLVGLAITESKRTPLLPNVPTMAEQGFKGVEVDAWLGLLGPKGLPADVVKILNSHINEILKMPDVVERLQTLGAVPVGGTPEELRKQIVSDFTRYGQIVKEFGIKAD